MDSSNQHRISADIYTPAGDEDSSLNEVELIQRHCEELFSMRDFVMEPQVITTLLAFFQAGGQPERVIELLSDNYQGLGQHANLLACWLADLELEKAGDCTATTSLNVLGDAERKIDCCSSVRDCFESTVNQMIKRQFLPEAADRIFEADGTEGIGWLPELISHKPWRRLIYELAEHFPNCLMLNFAIKLISDAGFQHEISNVNTAAQQLDIFSRVFLSSIEQLLDEYTKCEGEQLTESYQKHFAELKRVACHSEQTFLYTQMLLNYVAWKENGKRASIGANIAQHLRIEFEGRKKDIFAVQIGMIQSCLNQIPRNIVHAMLTMLAKGLNPADITQLYQAFSSLEPPPIQLIQSSTFLDMLIDALFNAYGPRINEEHRPKYLYLLAYACSVSEVNGEGEKKIVRRINTDLREVELNLQQNNIELRSTVDQMEQLVNVLYSPEDILLSLGALLRLVQTPVLAAGVLHYLKTLILRQEDLLAEPSTLHFVLIDQIARIHRNLLLCALYDHQSSRNEVAEVVMERQRHVVDRFVHLLYSGMAIPVLGKICSMFKEGHIDLSLVRYFGIEVLELLAPPYSKQFKAAFLPIIANREVFDRTTLEKHPSAREFLENCC